MNKNSTDYIKLLESIICSEVNQAKFLSASPAEQKTLLAESFGIITPSKIRCAEKIITSRAGTVHADPACPTCTGTGVLVEGSRATPCPDCNKVKE